MRRLTWIKTYALVVVIVLMANHAIGSGGLITKDNIQFRITQLEFRTHNLEQQIDSLNDIISDYDKLIKGMEKRQ